MVQPDGPLPYATTELELTRKWLSELAGDGISQRDLAQAWEDTADEPPAAVASAWLDGGPVTEVKALRDSTPGITVLMEEDVSRVQRRGKDLMRLLLPMPPPPRAFAWQQWARMRGLPVAPIGSIHYDPERGAQWRKT